MKASIITIFAGILFILSAGVASAGYGQVYGGYYPSTYGSYQQVYAYPAYQYPQYQYQYQYPQYQYSYPQYQYPQYQYQYPYYDYYSSPQIEITEPDRGDTFDTGDRVTIEWDLDDEPNNSYIELVIHKSNGSRLGTIARVSAREDDYRWRIPSNHREGSFYIKAQLVGSNGYVLDSDESGVFKIRD
jgi:hypothetical protein